MKYLIPVSVLFTMVLFMASPVFAQMSSAKGSAAISGATLIESTDMTHSWDPILSSYIKIPQDKELVFDVALECGLYTDTLVRSKGGTKDTSNAMAQVQVRVALQKILGVDADGKYILDAEKIYAYPGESIINPATGEDEGWGVTYCKREQELMAKFQGIFQQCEIYAIDPDTGLETEECAEYGADTCLVTECTQDDLTGEIDCTTTLDIECLDYEEVQLIQNTVSANAFNFVSPNLDQGEYQATVEAEIKTTTDFDNGGAEAKGLIGLGSMVVDEVRFINGDTGQNKLP